MDYFESVVVGYLRADRAIFLNTECCIQINEGDNPDTSGPHWYCDAVACDFKAKTAFLCEFSYAKGIPKLGERLRQWEANWESILVALARDSCLPKDWSVRTWLFVPEEYLEVLLRRLRKIQGLRNTLSFRPRITTLEMTQPWRYRSWNRQGEADKPEIIPTEMRS